MIIKGFERTDYLELQEGLLFYFGRDYYENDEELQQDFESFKASGLYELAMAQLGHEGIQMEGRHWKLCRTCGKPFLTMDKRSVSLTCYREEYNRHSKTNGRPFKGDYVCRMKYKAKNQSK